MPDEHGDAPSHVRPKAPRDTTHRYAWWVGAFAASVIAVAFSWLCTNLTQEMASLRSRQEADAQAIQAYLSAMHQTGTPFVVTSTGSPRVRGMIGPDEAAWVPLTRFRELLAAERGETFDRAYAVVAYCRPADAPYWEIQRCETVYIWVLRKRPVDIATLDADLMRIIDADLHRTYYVAPFLDRIRLVAQTEGDAAALPYYFDLVYNHYDSWVMWQPRYAKRVAAMIAKLPEEQRQLWVERFEKLVRRRQVDRFPDKEALVEALEAELAALRRVAGR